MFVLIQVHKTLFTAVSTMTVLSVYTVHVCVSNAVFVNEINSLLASTK